MTETNDNVGLNFNKALVVISVIVGICAFLTPGFMLYIHVNELELNFSNHLASDIRTWEYYSNKQTDMNGDINLIHSSLKDIDGTISKLNERVSFLEWGKKPQANNPLMTNDDRIFWGMTLDHTPCTETTHTPCPEEPDTIEVNNTDGDENFIRKKKLSNSQKPIRIDSP